LDRSHQRCISTSGVERSGGALVVVLDGGVGTALRLTAGALVALLL
jgi:hypothetical protein